MGGKARDGRQGSGRTKGSKNKGGKVLNHAERDALAVRCTAVLLLPLVELEQ